MSRKLTIDVDHIDPRNGDRFGWTIINNGNPLSFTDSGLTTTSYDKTFISNNVEVFNTNRILKTDDNYELDNVLQSFNGDVYDIVKFTDGKIVIVGNFTQYGDTPSERIIILNTNYTIFRSYPIGTGANGIIRTVILDSGNIIYIGGDFTSFNGVVTNRIAKLNTSNNLDISFTNNVMSAPINKGFNNKINKIVRIGANLYITGAFTNFNNNNRNRIISLTTAGNINNSFTILDGLNGEGVTILVFDNGNSIIVGGFFSTYRLNTANRIIRINLNGSPNNLTNFGTGFSGSLPSSMSPQTAIKVIKTDNSGNLLIGGGFTSYKGDSVSGIVRINSAGTLINNFGTGFNRVVNDIQVLPNNNIVIVGDFTTYKSSPALYNVLVDNNTDLIETLLLNNSVLTIDNISNSVLLGGSFTQTEIIGTASQTLTTIPLAEEIVDFGTGFDLVVRFVLEANNEIHLFGQYSEYNSNTAINVSKISDNGTFILGFTGSTNLPTQTKQTHSLFPDGSMIFVRSGSRNGIALSTNGGILKFNSDFTRDTTFNSGATGFSPASIGDNCVNDDDYIYVYTNDDGTYNGVDVSGCIVKINASNGNYVDKITKPTAYIAVFPQMKLASNGDLLYTNIVTTNGFSISRTGTFNFNENLGVNNVVELSNGNLVIVGRFGSSENLVDTKYGVSGCRSVAIISPNGQSLIQGNINTGWSSNASYLVYVDSLDRIYISRPSVTTVSYNGVTIPSSRKLIRLNSDLTLDNSFIINIDNNFIDDVLFKDDYIVIVGSFTPNSIIFVDYDGNELTSFTSLTGTIQNTYNNFNLFHNVSGITHSIDGNIVRMEYTFDDDEVVITDVFDVPEHVEVTFENESLLITDLIDDVVVRSPHFIISTEDDFDTVDFDIRVWEGLVFEGASQSVLYSKTKQKIANSQNSIYINVSNLCREELEASAISFLDLEEINAKPLSDNISKWVQVDYTTYLLGATVSQNIDRLFILDGYLDPVEEQYVPYILKTGNERYISRNQTQRLYFQVNRLISAQYITSNGEIENLIWDIDIFDNKKFVQSIKVKTGDFDWIDYIFIYDDTFGGTFEEKIRYNLYNECFYDNNSLVFKNKWGVLESIPVTKKLIENLNIQSEDFTRSIVDFNGNYDINRHTNKQFNIRGEIKYEINTDFFPEYMNDPIKEMLLSEEIWLLTSDNQLTPVILEDTNKVFKTKRNDKLIQYTFSVKTSHQQIKNIL
jgi:hypothetical protein